MLNILKITIERSIVSVIFQILFKANIRAIQDLKIKLLSKKYRK